MSKLGTSFYHQEYGNCFTFNDNITDRMVTRKAGVDVGLVLTLNARPDSYLEMTESVGFRIVFHVPGVLPFPDVDGLAVMPGYENVFILTFSEISYLPKPYGNCISSPSDVKPYFYSGIYSVTACQFSYKQQMIIDECNCTSPQYPAPDGHNGCGLEQKGCVEKVEEMTITNQACMQRCWEENFDFVTTKTKLRSQVGACGNPDKCDLSRETANVKVYYGSLQRLMFTEIPNYTITDMVGDFGGTIGLFLGASVISCVEVVYLIGVCFTKLVKGVVNRRQSSIKPCEILVS